MNNIAISVLMSVYNTGEVFLREAIESILNQTFDNFEFVIINDCSEQKCVDVLTSYHDSRIRIIHNEVNLGLANSLNKGINACRGKYIARMDSDDKAVLDRLAYQYEYMEKHPEIDVLGTYAYQLGTKKVIKPPFCFNMDNRKVKQLFYNAGVLHPTVFIRSEFLKANHIKYKSDFPRAEDYDMWVRIAEKGTIANVKKKKLFYRIHEGQVTAQFAKQQQQDVNKIRYRQLMNSGVLLSNEELELYYQFCDAQIANRLVLGIIQKIRNANKKTKMYNAFWLDREFVYIWVRATVKQIIFHKDLTGLKYWNTYKVLLPTYWIYILMNMIG